MHGAGQEMNRRAGTENVIGIVGLGMACAVAARDLQKNQGHMKMLRDKLQEGLLQRVPNVVINGGTEPRLPNTLSASFLGINTSNLMDLINSRICVSAGAACHSQGVTVSHVLEAMHVPLEYAKGTVRFSTGISTTGEEIEAALDIICEAVDTLRMKQSNQ